LFNTRIIKVSPWPKAKSDSLIFHYLISSINSKIIANNKYSHLLMELYTTSITLKVLFWWYCWSYFLCSCSY